MKKLNPGFLIVILGLILIMPPSCKKDKEEAEDRYLVAFNQDDEDYIDFGTLRNFTNNSDWAVIEKVRFPSGTSGGWHVFRGKAWEDKTGDFAISINESRVHAWVGEVAAADKGWVSLIHETTFLPDTWYTICFQYTVNTRLLELYIDGVLKESATVQPLNDETNPNKVFWGGQDCDPVHNEGIIYSEASIEIAHQAWYSRALTANEISGYNGSVNLTDSSLEFSSEITSSGVSDASGNAHNGVIGNSPEFVKY